MTSKHYYNQKLYGLKLHPGVTATIFTISLSFAHRQTIGALSIWLVDICGGKKLQIFYWIVLNATFSYDYYYYFYYCYYCFVRENIFLNHLFWKFHTYYIVWDGTISFVLCCKMLMSMSLCWHYVIFILFFSIQLILLRDEYIGTQVIFMYFCVVVYNFG